MSLDLSTLVGLLADHGGAAFWAVLRGILLWGAVSLAAGLLLYFLPTRLGWLEPRGGRRRGARVVYGLVIFLLCAPLATGAGVVHELRNATVKQIRKELERADTVRLVGGVLVAPAVLARLAATGRLDNAKAALLSFETLSKGDMSFLLADGDRQGAFARLTGELVHEGARKVPGYEKTEKNRVLRFLVRRAERKAAEKAGAKLSPYTRLFEGLRPDAGGKLTFDAAARQVGRNFFAAALEPKIKAPFDALRLKLLAASGLLWLLTLLGLWLTGRRGSPTAAAAPPGAPGAAPPGARA